MNKHEEYVSLVRSRCFSDIGEDDEGCIFWYPPTNCGRFDGRDLRIIAAYLDEINTNLKEEG